jgi:hypothetical protein
MFIASTIDVKFIRFTNKSVFFSWSSSVVDDGPPSYDDAIKDERWQCTSGDHQPPPMYTESENDTIQQQPNDDHAVVVMPTVADDEHTHQSSASD